MSNFAFLPEQFRSIADSARKAEGHAVGDPRAACFYARLTLEAIVHWLYQHDGSLTRPYENSLGALLHAPCLKNLLPQAVFQKARLIQQMGNHAVHDRRSVPPAAAMQMVKELHHICYWLVRSYAPQASRDGASWRDDRVPQPVSDAVVPLAELEALEARLAKRTPSGAGAERGRAGSPPRGSSAVKRDPGVLSGC